jgi:hypothetical protein
MSRQTTTTAPAPRGRAAAGRAAHPGDHGGAAGPRRLVTAVVVLAAAALGLLAVLSLTPRSPVPATVPATAFSADRAYAHITRIAGEPRPTGSAAAARTREYIAGRLRGLGLTPVTRSATTAVTPPGRTSLAGRVTNLHATIAGRPGAGTIVLVAHHDSRPNSPGASDDGIGVAAMLEVARALVAGPRPRHTVVLLFTDGEEAGLLGAHAYLASGSAPPPGRSVVLNLEARGTSGPVLMFETGGGDRGLVSALRGAPPVTTSFAAEVYRRLPNDTDFTEFRKAGFTGMNFAIVGGAARYDTPEDTIDNVSRASLQDMGSVVLGATRRLAGGELPVDRGAGAVYFTMFGALVSYPLGLALPLAVLALAGYLAALWYARRRGVLRLAATASAGASVLLPIAAAGVVGWAGWLALGWMRPEYAALSTGTPHRGGPAAAGLTLVAVAAVAAWLFVVRRRRSAAEVVAAVAGWLAVLSLLTAVVMPGGHYLFTWPALAGAAGVALAAQPRWRPAGVAAAAVPAVVLLAPVTVLLFSVVGPAFAVAPLVLAVVAALAAAPLALRLPRPRVIVAALALAGTAAVAFGAAVHDRPDARHPAQSDLVYTVDADSRTARWVSATAGTGWTRRHVPDGPVRPADGFPMLLGGGYRTGRAPLAAVPTPEVTGTEVVRAGGDVREYRLRIAVGPGTATSLAFYVDTTRHAVEGAWVDGAALRTGRNRVFAGGPWMWGAEFAAPGGGVDLRLRVRGAGPARLRLVAQSPGVPAAALSGPRPADVTWAALDAGITLAARTHRLT